MAEAVCFGEISGRDRGLWVPDPRTTRAWITSCQGLIIQAMLFHLESWTGWKHTVTSKPHQEANTLYSHDYWTRLDLVNTQFTPHIKHFPGKVRAVSFVFTRRSFIYLRWRWEAAGQGTRAGGSQWLAWLPLSHHIHPVRARWLSFSEAQECGRFSPAVGCLRETHPPSPKKYSKAHFPSKL